MMLDGVTAVYRSNVDLFFSVIGEQTENEVTLYLLNLRRTLFEEDIANIVL